MPTPQGIRISVTLDKETDDAARIEAAKQGLSKSQFIASLVAKMLKTQKENA